MSKDGSAIEMAAYIAHPLNNKIRISKRGKSPESFSSLPNTARRVLIDRIAGQIYDGSLIEGHRVAVGIFDSRCYLCGFRLYTDQGEKLGGLLEAQADHVHPPLLGGATVAGNMAPAHKACNAAKGDISVEIYLHDRPAVRSKLSKLAGFYNFKPLEGLYEDVENAVSTLMDEFDGGLQKFEREWLESRGFEPEVAPMVPELAGRDETTEMEENPTFAAAVAHAKLQIQKQKALEFRYEAERQVARDLLKLSYEPVRSEDYMSAGEDK